MIRVWDPLLRVFHWALVASVAIAWLAADEIERVHVWAGYAVGALIAFRLVWGIVGPRHARFGGFLPSPGRLRSYLSALARRRAPRYLGHNPAGAVMIVALIATLSITVWTGWLMEGAPMPGGQAAAIVGPAFADSDVARDAKGPKWAEEVHEAAANLLLVLIGLHVAGVLWASRHQHENLARAMVTGRKRAPGPGDIA
jgi:cytochrome b